MYLFILYLRGRLQRNSSVFPKNDLLLHKAGNISESIVMCTDNVCLSYIYRGFPLKLFLKSSVDGAEDQ